MPMTKMERQAEQRRLQLVSNQADDLIQQLGMSAPINPLDIVQAEHPLLRAGGRNLKNRYDGKLEYDRAKNRFLLFYNTKYDILPGVHHPRTRFSIAHELGHYFIERHRAFLIRAGGQPHESRSEFSVNNAMERDADAFAATLLLPTPMIRPYVNQQELTVQRIGDLCDRYHTSLVSTAIRSVRLSHFPCGVAGIRHGGVAWMFLSDCMIEAGLYPRVGQAPATATKSYADFQVGTAKRHSAEGRAGDWFAVYNDQREMDYVTEEYVPVPTMNTLLVLLTMDEFEDEDAAEDDDQ